jgi:outer membrane murein-binding lipoprotein Lpp
MKKLLLLAASPVLFLAVTGCEQAQKTQEAYSNLSKLKDAGEKLEANMDAAKERRAERVKNGDTLALPYKDLEKYLPTEVSGYTAAEPSGQSMKTAGMAFSTAERKFTRDSVEVTVKLMDYNGANQLYQGVAAMASLGLESEDDESLIRTTSLAQDGVKGTETFHKKTGEADVTLVVGDRFTVTVSGTHQKDLSQVEAVAKSLDLDAMAKL